MNKSNVFEVSVTEKDKGKINEARLTKSFMDDCLEVARKLKKQEAENE